MKYQEWLNETKKALFEFDATTIPKLQQRILNKAKEINEYPAKIQQKMDSTKKNSDNISKYKMSAAAAKDPLSKEINLQKSNQAQMKSQINSLEAKVNSMKYNLAQEELKTLNLQKTKIENSQKT